MRLFDRRTSRDLLQIMESDLDIDFSVGLGGRAQVHKASWNGESVVVKLTTIYSGICTDELSFLLNISHPNIIALAGVCTLSPVGNISFVNPGLILPYYPGGDLKSLLYSYQEITWKMRYQVSLDAARAISYLHQHGVMHRDINPSNILIKEGHRAVLCDLNYAVSCDPESIYKAKKSYQHVGGGDPAYIAPELSEQLPTYSAKIDVFAFGIALWAIATRKRPWRYCYPTWDLSINYDWTTKGFWGGRFTSDTPASFALIVERCWRDEQTQRPTMAAVRGLIESSARGEHINLQRRI